MGELLTESLGDDSLLFIRIITSPGITNPVLGSVNWLGSPAEFRFLQGVVNDRSREGLENNQIILNRIKLL